MASSRRPATSNPSSGQDHAEHVPSFGFVSGTGGGRGVVNLGRPLDKTTQFDWGHVLHVWPMFKHLRGHTLRIQALLFVGRRRGGGGRSEDNCRTSNLKLMVSNVYLIMCFVDRRGRTLMCALRCSEPDLPQPMCAARCSEPDLPQPRPASSLLRLPK